MSGKAGRTEIREKNVPGPGTSDQGDLKHLHPQGISPPFTTRQWKHNFSRIQKLMSVKLNHLAKFPLDLLITYTRDW